MVGQMFRGGACSNSVPSVPPQSSQGGGHRTLLYGHAILLRHAHSGMVSASRMGWGRVGARGQCPQEAHSPLQP